MVEWIYEDGKKRLKTSLEIFTISGAYDKVYNIPKTAKHAQVRQGKGQERNTDKASHSRPVGNELQRDVVSSAFPCPEKMGQPQVGNQLNGSGQDQKTEAAGSNDQVIEPLQSHLASPPHRDVYFYLYCPRIATNRIVLVPLDPNMTLAAALRNRTVLEFPTIYVLPYSRHELSTGAHTKYMLEDVYLQSCDSNEGVKPRNDSRSEESDENGDGDDGSPGSDEDDEDDGEEEDDKIKREQFLCGEGVLSNIDEIKVLLRS